MDLGADANIKGSNGASLLWQSGYFGKPNITEFLLMIKHDPEERAFSPDSSTLSLTALHTAAIAGHAQVVAHLVNARANLDPDNGHGVGPLDDAIARGHSDVVKELVEGSADLLKNYDRSGITRRRIDDLFDSHNPVLVSAAAVGLAKAPSISRRLHANDLIRFLTCPGAAPYLIMRAIFTRVKVQYWDNLNGKMLRVNVQAAYINQRLGITVACGPHPMELRSLFLKKTVLPDYHRLFLSRIAPTQQEEAIRKERNQQFVPVAFFACTLASVHEDLRVLVALADCPSDCMFEENGCKAFVEIMWQGYIRSGRIVMIVGLFEMINLVQLNFILQEPQFRNELQLDVALALAIAFWIFLFLLHCVQAFGYVIFGLRGRYVGSMVHWFNLFVLLLRGCVTLAAVFMRFRAVEYEGFRIAFGIVVYLSWTKTLISFRQLKSVAIRILPITSTMWDVGPFVCVCFVYLLAFANMYYALGFYPFPKSFMMMYRLGILGDFDMLALEGVSSTWQLQSGNSIGQSDPELSRMHHIVQLMMIYMSFVMTVTMMNLFIAMLCLSYSTAAENAETAFLKSRANIVLELHAMHMGARRLATICRCRKRRYSSEGSTASEELSSGSLALSTPKRLSTKRLSFRNMNFEQETDTHVWFCVEQEVNFT